MTRPRPGTQPAALAVLLAVAASAAPVATAQDVAFAVTPDVLALADGAPAVVRLYETEYDVEGPGRATTRVRLATTALAPAGREAAGELRVVHGGFRALKRFDGVIRDASGAVVRRLDRRDAQDQTMGSLYDDLRMREASLYGDRYPFTVEWTYEVEDRGVLGWPTWRPQPEGRPVEAASFTLKVPAQTAVRTRPRDVEAPQVRYGERGHDVRVWTFGQRGAATTEPFGPPWWEQLPELRLGTDRFEIGGAPGRLDSWDGLGRWYGGLARGRQELPPQAHAEVRALLAGAESEVEKARRLYRHLQQTTRYVSVQLGLGGWQPYDAAYVFERRYGDCKALTNYMQALLAFAGIDSDPVLIEAGDDGTDLDPDFPDNVFNHVILRLPMRTDALEISGPADGTGGAVWLECTSPYAAFGHLGSFTEGRPGLLVGDDGGRLVETPTSPPEANQTTRTATVHLDERGSARAEVAWTLEGEPRADALAALDGATEAERGDVFRRVTGLSLDVLALDVSDLGPRPDRVRLSATLGIGVAARRAGSRLLVSTVPFAGRVPSLPAADDRRQPVRLGTAYADRDSVRFVPPPGYAVDRVPPPAEILSPVGRYALRASVEDGALVVIRELTVETTDLPAEAYREARDFFLSVAAADAAVAVLKRE